MKTLGLIGYPLGHSFSESYFTEKFREEGIGGYQYINFPIPRIDDFPELVSGNPDLLGLNVTIPYKEQVISYLDELDTTAREIGAVNTIKIFRSGGKVFKKGFNTDVTGFKDSLIPVLHQDIKSALILGTGGASKAIAYVLKQLQIDFTGVSRSGKNGAMKYSDLNHRIISENRLIINCTPLGTSPGIDSCPDIPYEFLGEGHILYDLVYNPPETLFMKKAMEKGSLAINGYEMLRGQAEAAWKIWTK